MKKALVLGASSGIGRELAKLLADDGIFTAITGRRKDLLEELQSGNPDKFYISSYDCTNMENTRQLDKVLEKLEDIDLFILCAGQGEINKDLDFHIENQTNLLNVTAFTESVTWAFNYFENKGRGHLVVITSIAGIRGGRVAPAYNASKAYQIHYLEGLRQRVNRLKLPIAITDIRPGFVDTAMAKGGGKFWVIPKEKAARQIYSHIKHKSDIAYVSKRWRLIAWLLKLIPHSIYRRL